jgi:hypothetical protein
MKLFAFGFGFTALRLVDIYADEFERISGTVRHAEKRDELHRQKLDAYLFDAAEHAEIASRIKEADVLLVSVPPVRSEDPVLSAFGQQIEASAARQVVYLSTVGVYGDHGGGWIDEGTAVSPQVDRAHARVTAERRWKDVAGDRLAVLRLAGIYGRRRNALARLPPLVDPKLQRHPFPARTLHGSAVKIGQDSLIATFNTVHPQRGFHTRRGRQNLNTYPAVFFLRTVLGAEADMFQRERPRIFFWSGCIVFCNGGRQLPFAEIARITDNLQ